MAEEPTLPSLPKVSWDSHSQTFINTRKRNRDGTTPQPLFNNSSDPAVFSSDDDPHVDNYASGRHRKKRYVGSWFQQLPTSSDSTFAEAAAPQPKPNRTFERQWDSGVWMGSDGSVDLDEGEEEEEGNEDEGFAVGIEPPAKSKLPYSRTSCAVPSIASEELVIRARIDAAIEEGNPEIDLSSLGATTIPDEPISRLAELALIPSVDKDVPFEQANPKLGLYLSKNRLIRAPGTLFNLEHLTFLSLRNNRITEIPPSIGKLRNLQELNLSFNRLRYLPGELLDLLKFPSVLSSIHIHPNPFYRPESRCPSDTESGGVRLPSSFMPLFKREDGGLFSLEDCLTEHNPHRAATGVPPCAWRMVLVARSPVQYSDSRGSVLSRFRLSSENEDVCAHSKEYDERQHFTLQTEDVSVPSVPHFAGRVSDVSAQPNHVLSLFELALKSASRAAQTWDLASYLSPQAPPSVRQSIDRIAAQRTLNGNSGTVPCSMCGRQIATPLAQWIEWWDISELASGNKLNPLSMNMNENAIPFLKRGCSWNCVPKPMQVGQYAPGSLVTPATESSELGQGQ